VSTWPAVALLGGMVGLDATSFPQVMISRPLVSGVLAGLLVGQPAEGAMLGAMLEIFDLGILPVGAARYPDSGMATVAAVSGYSTVPLHALDPGVLLLAVLFGLTWEVVGGQSTVWLRRLNERLVLSTPHWHGRPGRPLERLHLTSMLLDFMRAGLFTLLGALVSSWVLQFAAGRWELGSDFAAAVLTIAGATVLGALISVFGGWRERRRALVIGIVCGSLLLLVLR